MKVELGKKYKMRCGTPVEIIGTDFHGKLSVLGSYKNDAGEKLALLWSYDGKRYPNRISEDHQDLIEVHDVPEGYTEWHGGKMPVKEGVLCDLIRRDGRKFYKQRTMEGAWEWSGRDTDIIAYRVSQPKIRPFTKDEFIGFRDCWFIYKDGCDSGAYPCQRYDDDCVTINGYRHSWEQVLNFFRFSNGQPCGVQEND